MSRLEVRRRVKRWALIAGAALILTGGCSSSPDTSRGADLFARPTLGDRPGCATCHTVADRAAVGGPSLVGVGQTAANHIDGVDAAEYLRESILAPSAFLSPGWGAGMPSYAGVLTEDEVDALVAYLASLD